MGSTKAQSIVDQRSVTGVPSIRSSKTEQLWVVTAMKRKRVSTKKFVTLNAQGNGFVESKVKPGHPDPNEEWEDVRCYAPERLPCGPIPEGHTMLVVRSTPLAFDAREMVMVQFGLDYSQVRVRAIDGDGCAPEGALVLEYKTVRFILGKNDKSGDKRYREESLLTLNPVIHTRLLTRHRSFSRNETSTRAVKAGG